MTIVPFYDRSGLIHETLETLKTALTEEILVTIIVVLIMVMHFRSSLLISSVLPLAVLMSFIAMKTFGVDANVVALSGIAIGTIVDMGIIVTENILKHLDRAGPKENSLRVVYRAAREVGGAVLTAVSTTIVSFLPVFTMQAAEGKLFKPLAFTKTFALISSVIIALTIIPPLAHMLFAAKSRGRFLRRLMHWGVIAAGIVVAFFVTWWLGLILVLIGVYRMNRERIPVSVGKWTPIAGTGLAQAAAEGKPVIIDTWATWCFNCRVLDKKTFGHPDVIAAAARFVPLKIQLETAGSQVSKAFMTRFGMAHYSLPTTLLLDSSGKVRRVLPGVVGPDDMIAEMRKVGLAQSGGRGL